MLTVDKHGNDICCDEFPVLQIDCKSKQIKQQWIENFICNQYGKRLTKLEAMKMQFVCTCFHICWISAENVIFLFSKVV